MKRTLVIILTALLISACGGGGGSNDEPLTPTPQTVIPQLSVFTNAVGTGSINEGDRISIRAVVTNTNQSASFTWQQTQGRTIELEVADDGSEIVFVAPDLMQLDSEYIEFEVNAEVSGIKSDNFKIGLTIVNTTDFSDFADQNSRLVLKMAERNLQLLNVVQTIIEMHVHEDENTSVCSFSGVETIALLDNDENGVLSNGDSINYNLEQCYISAFSAEGYGDVSIDILEYDQEVKRLEMQVDFSRFFINDYIQEFTVDGLFKMVIVEADNQLTQIVGNNQPVQFIDYQEAFLTLNESLISRVYDYNNSEVNVSISAKMFDFEGKTEIDIEQSEPFKGSLNSSPEIGTLQISNEVYSYRLRAANPTYDNQLFFEVGNVVVRWKWNNFISGNLFSYINSTINFVSDQGFIRLPDISSVFISDKPAVARLLFNNKLEAKSNIAINFLNFNPPYDSIDFAAETKGAVLTIYAPEDFFFKAGSSYSACGFEVLSENQQSLSICTIDFTTQSDVIPLVKGTSIAFREEDYPILDASSSILSSGEISSYEWFEVTNFGVTFLSPSDEVTSITIPSNVREEVTIGLRVTNTNGITGEARQAITYIPLNTNYVLLDSAPEDFIGKGRQWVILDNNSFFIKFSDRYENAIELEIDNDDFFSLYIAPKEGEELKIGVYENATKFSSKDADQLGFDFSGAARGCGQLIADFEILEFEIENGEIKKLSLDFTQFCGTLRGAPLNGKVRINSDLNIN